MENKNKFTEQIRKAALMIKRLGKDNLVLVKHPDLIVPKDLRFLFKGIDVVNSKFLQNDDMYLMEKRMFKLPDLDLTPELFKEHA